MVSGPRSRGETETGKERAEQEEETHAGTAEEETARGWQDGPRQRRVEGARIDRALSTPSFAPRRFPRSFVRYLQQYANARRLAMCQLRAPPFPFSLPPLPPSVFIVPSRRLIRVSYIHARFHR